MSTEPQTPSPLDLLHCPLQGQHLIEASAGTGKTYALVNLCLRLIVEEALPISALLVVTFTEAAAQELAERLRARLYLSRSLLLEAETGQSASPSDPFLAAWLPRLSRPQALSRLQAALEALDLAQISTIHAFCQRVLQRFAFLSGLPFQTTLLKDQNALLLQAVADFWRRELYPAPAWKSELLLQSGWHPEALLTRFRPWLGSALNAEQILPLPNPHQEALLSAKLEEGWNDFCQLHQQVQTLWQNQQVAIKRDFAALKGGPFQARYVASRLKALGLYLEGPRRLPRLKGEKNEDKLEYFSAPLIQAKSKQLPSDLRFFEQVDSLLNLTRTLSQARTAFELLWQRRFLLSVNEAVQAQKKQRQERSFDDLLQALEQALLGPTGPDLAAAIRQAFPAALIDEFQDTDAVQYRIFAQIYPPATAGSLFLIGDPKQSIYRFRGADIFTYLKARAQLPASQRWTLQANFRSRPELLHSLALLFAREQPFAHPEIAYPLVRAGRNQERWRGPEASAALNIFWLSGDEAEPSTGKTSLSRQIPEWAAQEVQHLLQAGYTLRDEEDRWRDLQAGDLAVLVRSHREGKAIRQALQARGLPTVLHSEESVFESSEAHDLQVLLEAILHGRVKQIYRALACPSLGYSVSELYALQNDDSTLENCLEAFQHYRLYWLERGFASMWAEVVQRESLYSRLLERMDGERRVTNLRHLAELLAAEELQSRPGPSRLLLWLWRQRESLGTPQDHQLLQLDTDRKAVQILTVHKSKGLEFPVVFTPYLWASRRPNLSPPLPYRDLEQEQNCLDLGSAELEQHAQMAQQEALQEELRLLYVALTRAQFLNLTALAWVPKGSESALGHLLPATDASGLYALLEAKTEQSEGSWQLLKRDPSRAQSPPPQSRSAPPFSPSQPSQLSLPSPPTVPPAWRISSFSALSSGLSSELSSALSEDRDANALLEQMDDPAEAEGLHEEGPEDPFMDFPRGGQHGSFLHLLLEKIPPHTPPEDLPQRLRPYLLRRGYDPEDWLEILCQKLPELWQTPLPSPAAEGPEPLTLQALRRRMLELEFHLPIQAPLHAQTLNDLMQSWQPDWIPLDFRPVTGVLQGFMDLVFEDPRQPGRYYVADYKSNDLGTQWRDYAPVEMASSLRQHAYTLQATLYELALHRYLQSRLKAYRPEAQLGGVYFLFLRGMSPQHPGHGVLHLQPPLSLLEALSQTLSGTAP